MGVEEQRWKEEAGLIAVLGGGVVAGERTVVIMGGGSLVVVGVRFVIGGAGIVMEESGRLPICGGSTLVMR